MQTACAKTSLEIWVTCPYCKDYQDRSETLIEHLEGTSQLRLESCEIEINCEYCNRTFLITSIDY